MVYDAPAYKRVRGCTTQVQKSFSSWLKFEMKKGSYDDIQNDIINGYLNYVAATLADILMIETEQKRVITSVKNNFVKLTYFF